MTRQKKYKTINERGCGVLLHITSLPSRYGIGDLGPEAFSFVDFLAAAGQRYWQILPVGPVDNAFGCSPYMSLAAQAGNSLLISPDLLRDQGILTCDELEKCPGFSEYLVDFQKIITYKNLLLEKAFRRVGKSDLAAELDEFSLNEADWLDDYALFVSIREQEGEAAWADWPENLARRDYRALTSCRQQLADRIEYYKFEQFCFFKQWQKVKAYAEQKGVRLIGDLPIYVSLDSVDVWAHQDCFCLDDKTLLPTAVAGVPPDYFSTTGQLWGNPLYRWKVGRAKNRRLYDWWQRRFVQLRQLVDVVRIDHFRAFASYWQVPAGEKTAENGRWCKGPGKQFFEEMSVAVADMPIIAEDLGVITPEVEKLRDELGFPGMKILQFAFDSDQNNLYLPHNYKSVNSVVFTGTHDNNTSLGWYLGEEVSEEGKQRFRRYADTTADEVHWDFIRLAYSSIANTAIIPMQDILGFGADCRMNVPGTAEGNWRWRCGPGLINDEICWRLRTEAEFYGRCRPEADK